MYKSVYVDGQGIRENAVTCVVSWRKVSIKEEDLSFYLFSVISLQKKSPKKIEFVKFSK